MQLFYDSFFPLQRKKRAFKKTAVVGIGGNEGDVRKRFRNLFKYLEKHPLVHVYETSPILQNPPFGFLEQNDFYNAVMLVQTSLGPKEFLKFLLHTEIVFKRKRSFKNAPRTLDLDIIFYENVKYNDKNLKIPHPFWEERDSVLIPLSLIKGFNR